MPRRLIVLLLLLLPLLVAAQDTVDNRDVDFWVTFLHDVPTAQANPDSRLYAIGSSGTLVTVSCPQQGWQQQYTINGSGQDPIALPASLASGWGIGQVSNYGFHVTASAPITLITFHEGATSGEGTLVFPTRVLRQDYMAITYASDPADWGAEVAFLAVEDATTITFTLPCPTFDGLHSAGETLTVTLDAGQTYELEAATNTDFTGMRVSGNRPFAMFEGHMCGGVPINVNWRDYLFEQAIPLDCWGTSHIVRSTTGRPYGTMVKILSSADGCAVSLRGATTSNFILDEGVEHLGQLADDIVLFIQSSQPVAVALFSTGCMVNDPSATRVGDPSMVLVPPLELGVDSADFVVIPGGPFSMRHLFVIARTADLPTLTLDGSPVQQHFTPCAYDTTYSTAAIPANDCRHMLRCSGHFVAYTIMHGFAESTAYLPAARFPLPVPVIPPPPPVSDTLTFRDTLCQGQSYSGHGFSLLPPASGTFSRTDTLASAADTLPDTLRTTLLHLVVNPTHHTALDTTIVEGDTLRFADTLITSAGTYVRHLQNRFGCDSTVVLTVREPCSDFAAQVEVWMSGQFIDFDHPTLTFENRTPGAVSSRWAFGDGRHFNTPHVNRRFTFPLPDSVSVHLVTCNHDLCCFDTLFWVPTRLRSLWFPNVFAPDADLETIRTFGPHHCFDDLESFELYVYNRQGLLVFESHDADLTWDGTRGGQPCPQGAYAYTWSLRTADGVRQSGTGTVTLLR